MDFLRVAPTVLVLACLLPVEPAVRCSCASCWSRPRRNRSGPARTAAADRPRERVPDQLPQPRGPHARELPAGHARGPDTRVLPAGHAHGTGARAPPAGHARAGADPAQHKRQQRTSLEHRPKPRPQPGGPDARELPPVASAALVPVCFLLDVPAVLRAPRHQQGQECRGHRDTDQAGRPPSGRRGGCHGGGELIAAYGPHPITPRRVRSAPWSRETGRPACTPQALGPRPDRPRANRQMMARRLGPDTLSRAARRADVSGRRVLRKPSTQAITRRATCPSTTVARTPHGPSPHAPRRQQSSGDPGEP